ncbi:MAG TPA: PilZ domain-containing protein [Candidatus Omnitrophota bacterium]|nr:PilZ domain-containing protein [Candidatus Omnitrophota bacterium]HQJ15731.1 PilZ domain-containing protein [Candidatus Omnitrophota bacterium]
MRIDNPGDERRRFRRYKLTLNAFYRIDTPVYVRMWFGDQEFEAATLDISAGGIALLTNLDIPVSSTLIINITLFRLDRDGKVVYFSPGEILGEVRAKGEYDKKHFRLNICFVHPDKTVVDEINRFITANR